MGTISYKRKLINQIPNTLTLVNLLSGSTAILLAFNNQLRASAIALIVAFLADIFDGFIARLLNAQSLIGKELDSLSDMISFGLAPAFILHIMLINNSGITEFSFHDSFVNWAPLLLPLIIPAFAAIRLAKFNTDERQTSVFIGLPTPANALMVLSIPLASYSQPGSFIVEWFSHTWIIIAYSITVSILMVAPVHLYSLKLKGFGIKKNLFRYIFGVLALIILIISGYTGLFLIVVFYFFYGAILGHLQKKNIIS